MTSFTITWYNEHGIIIGEGIFKELSEVLDFIRINHFKYCSIKEITK